MTSCYKTMSDLPLIPEDLVQACMNRAHSDTNDNATNIHAYTVRTLVKNKKSFPSIKVPRYDVSDILKDWISTNITNQWRNIGIATTIFDGTSNIHGAHADGTRRYSLMYLLEVSNPDQYTKFYQEQGYPLYREPYATPLDLDKLDVLETVIVQPRTWAYLNVRILHGVENIQGRRTSIQVDLDQDPFGVFV